MKRIDSLKQREKAILDLINESVGTNLELCLDQYSTYDAEDDNYIVEVKERNVYYSTKFIESMKLFSNYRRAQLKGKSFLYVVKDSEGVWVFNMTKNIDIVERNYANFKLCEATSNFKNRTKIKKYGYDLDEGLAIKLETK